MIQRTLMLDIDGVLNSATWFAKMQSDALDRYPISNMIDPECVARLNTLIDLSGADVVISSSWRIVHPLGEIYHALKAKGFTGKIIGRTPKYMPPRGREIQEFMTGAGRDCDHLVILDDNSSMAHLTPRLVLTSWGVGLTDADVRRALELFGIEHPEAEEERTRASMPSFTDEVNCFAEGAVTELTDESELLVPGTFGEVVLASGTALQTCAVDPSLLAGEAGSRPAAEAQASALRNLVLGKRDG